MTTNDGSHGESPRRSGRARFGVFEMDLATGELRRQGRPVHLQPQPGRMLLALVRRAGRLVERDTLRQAVWGDDTVVEYDEGINYGIREVRRVLGDQATSPVFIETVPRRGYRFIAPVEWEDGTASGTASDPHARPWTGRGRTVATWATAAALVTAILTAGLYLAVERGGASRGLVADDGRVNPEAPERTRLVVLPFRDLGPEPREEWFADSLTEETIAHLAGLDPQRLGVISRVSAMAYRDREETVDRIADELGVDWVLEGSVRREGDQVRVTAQLVRASDQTHQWAETYDRPWADLLQLQDDVARRVTRSLGLSLLPGAGAGGGVWAVTSHPEAYREYLEGRYQWNRFTAGGYRRAEDHFRRALELDPGYAEAWAALADTYNLMVFTDLMPRREAFERAKRAAERALELAPGLAAAHNSLAFVLLYGDWNPEGALEHFERALELAPGRAMTHHWAAAAYASLGRFEEAVAAARRAVELDPVSLSVRADLGWYHLAAGQWRAALEQCEKALEISSGYGFARACRQQALEATGDLAGAAAEARERLRDGGFEAAVPGDLPGEPTALLEAAARLRLERLEAADVSPLARAFLHGRLGQLDAAFEDLNRAVEERDVWLVFLWADRRFAPLWGDPRFPLLAAEVGIPRPS